MKFIFLSKIFKNNIKPLFQYLLALLHRFFILNNWFTRFCVKKNWCSILFTAILVFIIHGILLFVVSSLFGGIFVIFNGSTRAILFIFVNVLLYCFLFIFVIWCVFKFNLYSKLKEKKFHLLALFAIFILIDLVLIVLMHATFANIFYVYLDIFINDIKGPRYPRLPLNRVFHGVQKSSYAPFNSPSRLSQNVDHIFDLNKDFIHSKLCNIEPEPQKSYFGEFKDFFYRNYLKIAAGTAAGALLWMYGAPAAKLLAAWLFGGGAGSEGGDESNSTPVVGESQSNYKTFFNDYGTSDEDYEEEVWVHNALTTFDSATLRCKRIDAENAALDSNLSEAKQGTSNLVRQNSSIDLTGGWQAVNLDDANDATGGP